jgi:calcium-translocating P-type ATPase
MKNILNEPWHALPFENVFDKLQTSEGGLTESEAVLRIHKFGRNELESKKGPSFFKFFFLQFSSPLIYVLVLSMVMAFSFGKHPDAAVIGAVVLINTLIGAIQEYKSSLAIESLSKQVPSYTFVIREGVKKKIATSHVTIGDILVLEPGERVCADARLFSAKHLGVDESILTGESLPAEKKATQIPIEAALSDRKNCVYAGTLVQSGYGLGVITAIGKETEFGKIASMLTAISNVKTPLTKALDALARRIMLFVVTMVIVVFVIGYVRGLDLIEGALTAVALGVAAIPEGLPAVITITAAIGVARMAKKNSIIRHLEAVETLGSTTIICTDKTGTLTENKMQVVRVEAALAVKDPYHIQLGAILCNTASSDREDKKVYHGDPTESALLHYCVEKGDDYEKIRQMYSRIDLIPFDTEKRWMATLHKINNHKVIFLKGAPEKILEKCSLSSKEEKQAYENTLLEMAQEGLRVLALAKKTLDLNRESFDEKDVESGFELLGFFGLMDPPRPEVKAAIKKCLEAGIIVKMITGDHPETAKTIARQIGIFPCDQVTTGEMLENLSEKELETKVLNTNLFARTLPHHKLQIVQLLQKQNHIVAMTGDGVNDAPSLKQADIGVAMGIGGTCVAKEASDVILVDDNFKSIEMAIEEGRRVYDNLIKAILFIFPTNLAQALIVFVGVLFFPKVQGQLLTPIMPAQILWVNLITAVALALPLAVEVFEPNIMRRRPRDPKKPIFSREIFIRTFFSGITMTCICVAIFFLQLALIQNKNDSALHIAQTSCVTTLVCLQIVYSFNCRLFNGSLLKIGLFSNRYFIYGILAVIFLQGLFIYVPFMQHLFESTPLDLKSVGISLCGALLFLPTLWIQRKIIHINGHV